MRIKLFTLLVIIGILLAACGGSAATTDRSSKNRRSKNRLSSGMNKGGSQELFGIRITMVDAKHSSSYTDDGVIMYLGEAAGYVLTFENGLTVYFVGDTSLIGDMRLIREMYRPTVAFLPIGDLFTMDPVAAAKAVEFLGVQKVIPMHYGTFPVLVGRPEQLRELVAPLGAEVLEMKPGDTV